MKALIQRVKAAKVEVGERKLSEIEKGLLILLGVTSTDAESDIQFLVEKISNLRIFEDEAGKMNLSLIEVKGEVLIVSQFTLYADCRKGRRPGFTEAAQPELANELYKKFIQKFQETGLKVEEGEFGAMMDVSLTNWGPVTIMLDTKQM